VNIVFMGTPSFALPALSALAAEQSVRAVFTRPDAPSHRGKTLLPSLVKARALELGIPVHTPAGFNIKLRNRIPLFGTKGRRVVDARLIAHIEAYEPDLIVVAAYGLLLPEEILALPTHGCINLHASLLPRWRGAAPIQRALLAGDGELGVSIMRMETGLDTGPYCAQAATPAAGKDYQRLTAEMGGMAAELLLANLDALCANAAEWISQDEALVTYADKVEKGSIDLDGRLTVAENHSRVCASSHHARCRTVLFGRPVMVLEARPARERSHKRVYYECANGLLEILRLKPDGRREMTGTAFLAGLR
jgi:methionyl-tRNA formyltransferase